MNVFQWTVISGLAALLLWELVNLWRGPTAPGFWLLRCVVWLAAAVTVARPSLVQAMASAIGIGRGTDALLYLFVLTFLGTSFYFYSRYVQLQRQLTEVVRHLAIQEARREVPCQGEAHE